MTIVIKTARFTIRPFKKGDEESLRENINNKKIYQATLRIPYPYTLKDAGVWIKNCEKQNKKGKPKNIAFAIEVDNKVCGCISLDNIDGHQAELGYWLGEAYWGRGVMTEAAQLVTDFGFKNLTLKRIYAFVFPFNTASMKVLEKAGFEKEGFLKKHVEKDGKLMDNYLFAKVAD